MTTSVVGRAYVNVRAVTRQVEPDIQKGVDDALDRVAAKVQSGSGKKIGESIGDGITSSKIDEKIEESIRSSDADKAGHDLGQAIGDAIFKDGAITAGIKRAFDAVIPEINETGDKIEATLDAKIARGLASGFAKVAFSPISWVGVAVPPVVTQGFTLLSTLSAAAVETISTLGPVIALAGATGAAGMTSLLTTIGAITLAFKLNTDAVSALKEGLEPLADEFEDIAAAIQDELFPALSEVAFRAEAALGDELQRGLVLTASAVAGLAREFATLTEQPFFQQNIADILESNAVSITRFGRAGVDAASILSDIGAAGGPAVERVALATKQFADNLAEATRQGRDSGGLNAFFDRAVDTSGQWVNILADTSAALFEIFSIGSTGTLLSSLEDVTQQFRDWAESATGRGSIQEWFDQARPVMSALGGVLEATGKAVGDLSGDTDALVGTLDSLATAMPGLVTILGTTTEHFADLLGTVLPLVGGLAEELAPAIGDAAEVLNDSLGPALERVVEPLGDVIEAGLSLADNFAPVVALFGGALAGALEVVAFGLEGLNSLLDALPGPVGTVILSVAALRVAFNQLAASTKFGPAIAGFKASMAEARVAAAATSASFVGLRAAASVTMATLGGPLGLALAAASIAFGIFAGKTEEATTNTNEFTDAMIESEGAINDQIEAMARKRLEEEGALQRARDLGIETGAVTEAALGNAEALRLVTGELDAMILAGTDWVASPGGGAMRPYLDENASSAKALKESITGISGELDAAAESGKRVAESSTWSVEVRRAAAEAARETGRYEHQLDRLDATSRATADSSKFLARTIISVRDASVKALDSQIGFRQAMADARKEFKDSKDTLDTWTGAGRDNVGALLDIAKAAAKVTGSAKEQREAMQQARDKVLELAESKTKDKEEAEKLTDRIFKLTRQYDKVPKNVKTKVESPTLEDQIDQATILTQKLEHLDGQTYTFNVQGIGAADVPTGPPPGVTDPSAGGGTGTTGQPGSPRIITQPGAPRTFSQTGPGGVDFSGSTINVQSTDYRDMLKKLAGKTRATQLSGYGGKGNDL